MNTVIVIISDLINFLYRRSCNCSSNSISGTCNSIELSDFLEQFYIQSCHIRSTIADCM